MLISRFSVVAKSHPLIAAIAILLFISAIIFLIWHNVHEAVSPGYEYVFALRLCEYVATCLRTAKESREERLRRALAIFHSVFMRVGIAHVSIHSEENGTLIIREADVYPSVGDKSYFVPLQKGEGVAGKVFADSRVRYVPRIYFPFGKKVQLPILGTKKHFSLSMYFPHAVKFAYKTSASGEDQIGRLEFTEEDPEVNVFAPEHPTNILYRACLSVPIGESDKHPCRAVLNFDFSRTDPLNKSDITMAAVFGLLLSDLIGDGQNPALPGNVPQRAP